MSHTNPTQHERSEMEARDSSLSSTNRSAAVQPVRNNGISHSKTPSNGIPPHLLYGSPTGYSTVMDMTHSEQKGPRDFSLNVIKRPWSDAKEQAVCGPYDYLVSLPGKDIRSKLIDAFNIYLQVPEESLSIIKHVVAMLHNASLLVDDVEDHSVLRRGYPVAHSLFGVAQTINSANYIYFRAMQDITGLKSPVCVQVFTEELINLHRGQGMDLFWRDTLTCPSEDDYLEMVSNKTGGLFRLAIKLMQAESASEVDYLDLVNLMGLIFQIRDDYMNLQSDQYAKNKGFAEDLTEGKFSFPIIHSIRANPKNLQMINILKQQTQDDGVKHYAVAYMRDQTKSFEYTASVLKDLQEQATGLLDSFGDNVALRAILENLKVDA
ncbi:geranylgeranyl pyrophosphate synthetase [Orbilia oligospora]|uniref:Geranylgeranyl pyrophosphate synthetase n=1 Tax=Orbilia oligospora TaxID=2813651 RepID=A0A7C8P8U6_ORBOL|nr:geranylgeranyl pyrophosphate synthetase [Orbilia oligospora]TGJ63617.1 geranylgeranyl pyrophosphate synthetase [Orbilia oligospora]